MAFLIILFMMITHSQIILCEDETLSVYEMIVDVPLRYRLSQEEIKELGVDLSQTMIFSINQEHFINGEKISPPEGAQIKTEYMFSNTGKCISVFSEIDFDISKFGPTLKTISDMAWNFGESEIKYSTNDDVHMLLDFGENPGMVKLLNKPGTHNLLFEKSNTEITMTIKDEFAEIKISIKHTTEIGENTVGPNTNIGDKRTTDIKTGILEGAYASYQYKLNDNGEVIGSSILISSYFFDDPSYDRFSEILSKLYSPQSSYENNNIKREVFTSYNPTPGFSVTVCIHEIKEEEGVVYHTLTFMPEEEYNQTLFQNYLNN